MCFVLWFKNADVAIPVLLWFSIWMVVGLCLLWTIGMLRADLPIQFVFLMPVHKVLYSAPDLERATSSCCRAVQDTAAPPKITRQPLIGFLIEVSPAQTASKYAIDKRVSTGPLYPKPACLVLRMYCNTLSRPPNGVQLDFQISLQVCTQNTPN